MRITALDEYGLRCLLALARKGQGEQLTIPEIAEMEGLSMPYASKLLSILRKSGLIDSVRGRGGGFCIARPPEEIDLLEVLTALGGPLIDPEHCNKFSGQLDECVHVKNCSVHYVLGGLAGYVGEFLSRTTLDDIIKNKDITGIKRIDTHVLIDENDLVSGQRQTEDHQDKIKNANL